MYLTGIIKILSARMVNKACDALANTMVTTLEDRMNELDNKITKIVESHYKLGIDYLKDAIYSPPSRKESRIEDARKEFLAATKVDSKKLVVLESLILVTCCFSLLGEEENTIRYLSKSHSYLYENFSCIHSEKREIAEARANIKENLITLWLALNASKRLKISDIIADELYQEYYSIAILLKKVDPDVKILSNDIVDRIHQHDFNTIYPKYTGM